MNISTLFRKRSPMTDEGMPWLNCSQEHTWTAKRNTTGKAAPSAILIRALISAIEGGIVDINANAARTLLRVQVKSTSTPGAVAFCWIDWSSAARYNIPHGEGEKITYHLGALGIVTALANPNEAVDFLEAYKSLMLDFRRNGKSEFIRPTLCRAADELYYWMRYAGANTDTANDRLSAAQFVVDAVDPSVFTNSLDANALTDPIALEQIMKEPVAPVQPIEVPAAAPAAAPGGFVGWQAAALTEAISNGDNVLLAGPTGTGKTYALHQVITNTELLLVTIEGKEGLTDLDFIGAILPQADGSRRWVDGPLLRAMRMAAADPVLLFLDEVNRVNRIFLNILLGLMNPKTGRSCRQMGLDVQGEGPFYVIEVPMTSEIVACPAAHLRIVAAGNFGRAYQVYDLDPAVRRRFDTVIEFDYLDYNDELALLLRETLLGPKPAEVLVKLAQETRRLLSNGELPGCVDTASLLNWAKKCQRSKLSSQSVIMQAAKLTWADTVCGRDHTGRVNQGAFKALEDYLTSLAIL